MSEMTGTTGETGGQADVESIKRMVEAWTRELVDGNYDAWIGRFTEDAMLMPPDHANVNGRDAIGAFVRDTLPRVDSFSFSDWRVEGQGDLAVVTNQLLWGETRFKQMIALRRRQGEWKTQLVMFAPVAAE